MPFQKGQPKPANSGRKVGSLNKKTVAKVSDFLGERGINPAEEILKIINEKTPVMADGKVIDEKYVLGSQARADLWIELLSFCHAKPKELTLKNGEDEFDPSEFDQVATDDLMKVLAKPPTSGTA